MPNSRFQIAVIGAAGYTGGEAIELILRHPHFELAAAVSESQAGKKLYEIHPRLRGVSELAFAKTCPPAVDALILCVGHGRAASYLRENPPAPGVKVVDLSTDFRMANEAGFVYGLPEAFAEEIRGADRVANPGCFATGIQLALLPLAQAGLLTDAVSVTAITGSTGAGQAHSPTTHFSWRAENLSAYKTLEHQHLAEIRRTLGRVMPGGADTLDTSVAPINFVPVRGDFTRGIFCVAQVPTVLAQAEVDELYASAFAKTRHTFHVTTPPNLQQVVRTNNCLVHPTVRDGHLAIVSVLDNLGKGASGQAIENLELMFGI